MLRSGLLILLRLVLLADVVDGYSVIESVSVALDHVWQPHALGAALRCAALRCHSSLPKQHTIAVANDSVSSLGASVRRALTACVATVYG